MTRPSAKRTYSIYLDDAENVAVNKIAAANHATPNAVCRALIRRALGLPALELAIPADIAAWAERRRDAAAADASLA